jgi:type IV pilus assembly protein PilO
MARAASPTREGLTRGVLLALLILAPAYFLYYSPTTEKLAAEKTRLAQLENELRNAQQVARTRDDLRRVTRRLETVLEFYEERLPSEEAIPGLLEELQEIVSGSKVRLNQVEMLQKQTLTNYERLPFRLVLAGGYHDIGRAVNSLERGKRFMGVDDIAIRGDGTREHDATVEVSTFRFIELRG